MQYVPPPSPGQVRKLIHLVVEQGQIGDWFVLYQLCKNCNPYFFRNIYILSDQKTNLKLISQTENNFKSFREQFIVLICTISD